MHRSLSLIVVLALVAGTGVAMAAAPTEGGVQGLYEGTRTDAAGAHKFEARVVAWGKGEMKVYIRETDADGKVAKADLDGKIDGEALNIKGKAGDKEWALALAGEAITGTAGADKVEMKKVVRLSPTMGAKPPAGAIVLLDSKNFDEMTCSKNKDGTDQEWKVAADGGVMIPKGGMTSKKKFDGSIKMHVEFKNPLMPTQRDQGRGNSGTFLPNGDEIQVLDSFGSPSYKGGGCGGLYRYKDPDAFDVFSLASAPPEQWQTYDIEYKVEKADGKPTGKPTVTVLHNGIKIHDNAKCEKDARAGSVNWQDHGNPVQYRNIWVVPIEEK
jgi:hypothetical protein